MENIKIYFLTKLKWEVKKINKKILLKLTVKSYWQFPQER